VVKKIKPLITEENEDDHQNNDTQMVDDFVSQLQESILIKSTTDKLQALVEENSQMKLDMDSLLIKHQQ
jgi:hypothetical protein